MDTPEGVYKEIHHESKVYIIDVGYFEEHSHWKGKCNIHTDFAFNLLYPYSLKIDLPINVPGDHFNNKRVSGLSMDFQKASYKKGI